jgi:uncharacterized protein DUF3455
MLAGFTAVTTALALSSIVQAQVPDAIAAAGEIAVLTVHAEGAQVYECKADAGGKLVWQFREPVATLILEGKTIGRHYAGPTWEHSDGSAVMAKAVGRSPGVAQRDIPWLKLEVTERRGSGVLADVSTIQRINTQGGATDGSCERGGALLSMPYSSTYVFLRKGG